MVSYSVLIGTRIVERITRLLLWHYFLRQQERVRLGHILIHHRVQHGRMVPRVGVVRGHGVWNIKG